MSVVVAIKYKNGVAMASDRQLTWGNMKIDSATKMRQTNWSNIGLGCVGSGRLCDLIEIIDDVVPADDILKGIPITRPYLIKNVVPYLFQHFKKYNGLIIESNEMAYIDGTMLICTPELIHAMCSDGTLVQCDKFAAIGCGDQLAYGYLNSLDEDWVNLKEKRAIDILVTCIRKCCKDDVYIGENVDVLLLEKV